MCDAMCDSYPEIDDANFEGTLWNCKQWPALKMGVRYGLSIFLPLTSLYNTLSVYSAVS